MSKHSTFNTATPVRVLVVDDSDLQRSLLIMMLERDPAIQVVGQARNGEEALARTATLHPDVITVDLQMPGIDGLETTRRIMQQYPTPVVLVAMAVSPADQRLVGEALAAGVLAVVAKPSAGPGSERAVAELTETVKRMAEVRVIRRRQAEVAHAEPGEDAVAAPPLSLVKTIWPQGIDIVAIGASTGGPQVLQTILTKLPATFRPPVLIVQHIAEGFGSSIATWLGPQCALPFNLAEAGTILNRPGIYLAPPGKHLIVQGQRLAFSTEPPIRGHRPSATILFRSVAAAYQQRAVGILLTGMGDDGAVGLAAMKQAGAVTIAQDEASSVVFGMPGAAVALGVVDYILPPHGIPPLLLHLTSATPATNQTR